MQNCCVVLISKNSVLKLCLVSHLTIGVVIIIVLLLIIIEIRNK